MEVVLPSTELMLEQLICMLCRQIPNDGSSTIYLCTNNHLYCCGCYGGGSLRGKKCRMVGCQEVLRKTVDPIVQEIYLNSLFQCSYFRCDEVVLGGNLKNHQISCHYRAIECPSCKYQVNFDDYLKHLDKTHSVDINPKSADDSVLNIRIRFPTADSYSPSSTYFHKFNDESFFVHLITRPKEITIWIQYYGEIWREGDFTATITMENIHGHKTEIAVPINPIHETFKTVQKSLSYAHLYKDLLRFYLLEPSTNQLFRTEPTEMNPGHLQIQVLFRSNYLQQFIRSLRNQRFGLESEC